MILAISGKDTLKAGTILRKTKSGALKSIAGSDVDRAKGTRSERIARAFETASKRTGAFESSYAKKRS